MVDLEFKGASWQTNADKDGFVTRELVLQNVPVFLPDGDARGSRLSTTTWRGFRRC